MLLVILLDVEVDRAVDLVGLAIVEDFLNQFLLFDDMACGMRLNARREQHSDEESKKDVKPSNTCKCILWRGKEII